MYSATAKYKYITSDIDDTLAIIRLHRSTDNSLNIEMMTEIIDIHKKLNDDKSVKGILLTSDVKGFFSNGLDIEDLLNRDTNGKLKIFEYLYDMADQIYRYKNIHVSFVNGHAMAGGAILAAMSDFRFQAAGPYRFCFSEAKLGLPLNHIFLTIIESIVGSQNLKYATLLATAYKPAECLNAGLADELIAEDNNDSQGEGLARVKKFLFHNMQIPSQSYQAIKLAMREKTINAFRADKDKTLEWLKGFFNENFNEALLATKEKRRPHFT